MYIYIYIYIIPATLTAIRSPQGYTGDVKVGVNMVGVNMVLAEYHQIQTWLLQIYLLFVI